MIRYVKTGLLALCVAGCEKAGPPATPQSLVADFAALIRNSQSFSVDVATSFHLPQEQGANLDTEFSVKVQRPDHAAFRLIKGTTGIELVADGKQIFSALPSTKRYTQETQEGDLQSVAASPEASLLAQGFAQSFFVALIKNDITADLMEGVTASEIRGIETLNGQSAQHLHFTQKSMDWDMWIPVGGNPLLVQIRLDLSKRFNESENGQRAKKRDAFILIRFSDWKLNPKLPADAFAFIPPEGAQKVEELFESPEVDSPLLGTAAPEFRIPLLDGGTLNLAEHRNKHIVVLDFWATWCGPCVMALPVLQKVTDSFKDRNVVFYAIDQQEDPDSIRKFFERKSDLKVTVALDQDGKVGEQYHLEGIPRSVIIGKDGRVQSVHEGFSPSLQRRLTRELSALVAGKDLAEEKRKAASMPASTSQSSNLRQIWTLPGPWDGVATDDASDTLVAVSSRGPAIQISPTGERIREFRLAHPGGIVRLGNLTGDATPELLTFDGWGGAIAAHSADGHALWAYPGGSGVDDVWLADLTGDGLAEVILGYNGATGLHLLSNAGKPVWKYTKGGNYWHVCAGPMGPKGQMQIVSTSAQGILHVFNPADGAKIRDIKTDCYSNMVRIGRSTLSEKKIVYIAGGSTDKNEMLIFLDENEEELARTPIGGKGSFIDSAQACQKYPWVAIGLRGGMIRVVRTDGQPVGQTYVKAERPEVAWNETGSQPQLLVATGAGVFAFVIEKQSLSSSAPVAASTQ